MFRKVTPVKAGSMDKKKPENFPAFFFNPKLYYEIAPRYQQDL